MFKNVTNIVADLPHWGLVSVSGIDAGKFLQGQITQDIKLITDQQAGLGAFLTLKGRVIATFFIVKKSDQEYVLILPKDNIGNLVEKLSKYVIFSKAKINDVTAQYSLFAFWAEQAQEAWRCENPEAHLHKIQIAHTNMQFVITHELQAQRFKQPYETTDSKSVALNLIMAGIPTINNDSSEVFTVHDLNLPELGAVNFKKGCYTGQEIVARTHYKAKLKHHLYPLKFSAEVKVQQIFLDENNSEVGRIVNAITEGENTYSLTWLKDNMLDTMCLNIGDEQSISFELFETVT